MEYVKRIGRKIFSADVTHNERGDWAIRSGAFRATLPMTGPEADVWTTADRPVEPTALPVRIEDFVSKVGRAASAKTSEPKRVKYSPSDWMPLDGEESVSIFPIERRTIQYGAPGEAVTAQVRCNSSRCQERGLWTVVQLPGSQYDKATTEGERVEGISPADFAEQHRAWHAKTFQTSARVELDRWIKRHEKMVMPELTEDERREINLGLVIAKSER